MGFKVILVTQGTQHPPFNVETYEEGVDLVKDSLESGSLLRKEESMFGGEVEYIYQLGPGTIFRVLSEERENTLAKEQKAAQRNASQGLIHPPAELDKKPWKLVIQLGSAHLEPPLGFDSEGDASGAARAGARHGRLTHELKDGEDFFGMNTGPGTVFMVMTSEEHDARRRQQIEMLMQQAAQQRAQQSKILLPGRGS
jgi:hypothetical protein